MKIQHNKTITIEELASIIPREAGATWNSLWQIFYFTRMFKYVHKKQYPKIKPSFNKICTHGKLQELCSLGYLKNPDKEIYTATNKVLPILKAAGYVTETLPFVPKGMGYINEINNTEVFIQALKLPTFETLLFPRFNDSLSGQPYLIPDALLVQKHAELKRYKLTFLEIEAKKPKWKDYIDKKRENYIRLSTDKQFARYWASVCLYFGVPIPKSESLIFSVCIVGNILRDFGNGFIVKQSLLHEKSR